MQDFLTNNVLLLVVLSGIFTFSVTAMGSASVFLFKSLNRKVLAFMLSFAAGVMFASMFFSLILPAMEMSRELNQPEVLNVILGLIFGMFFILFSEMILNKLQSNKIRKKSVFSALAITLHNIPEGMCIGVAFAMSTVVEGGIYSAIMLALGIGLQNFPEGAAVSMPLHKDGFSKKKSFLIGASSAIAEPIFAVIAYLFVWVFHSILPFLLSFTAGVMLAVSAIELLPESVEYSKKISTLGLIAGFCLMALLDIML